MKRRILQLCLAALGITLSSCEPDTPEPMPMPEYGTPMTMFRPSERVVDPLKETTTEDEQAEPTTDNTSL